MYRFLRGGDVGICGSQMRPHGVQVERAPAQKDRSHQTQVLVRLFLESDDAGGDGGDVGVYVYVCVC